MKLRSICGFVAACVLCAPFTSPVSARVVDDDATSSSALTAARSGERGLSRFFGIDQPLLEVPAYMRGRTMPRCVKALKPDEPAGEPFRGMLLDPMFDADGRPLVAACYDANDPPPEEVFILVEAAISGMDRFFIANRWSGSQGTLRNLRWSFVPDGLNIPNGIGEGAAPSSLFATMDAKFGGNRAAWISLFEQSFARWSQLAGLTYQRITFNGMDWDDGASWGSGGSTIRGDIRISMKPIDGGSGVLAYNSFPSNGDMVLDAAENWQSSGNNFRFARNTIMHEHGHGLGMNHSCPGNNSKLMEPFLSTSFDGPRQDDMRAGHRHYGDVYGNNNTFGAATDLGSLGNSQSLFPSGFPTGITSVTSASRTSIDNNTEQDYFRFTIDAPRIVNISLIPVGSNYANYPQNSNGSCQTGPNNENSLTIRDLAFDVINSAGLVQISMDGSGIGLGENLNGLLLSPAGNWTIRVRSTTNDSDNVQMYSLVISGVSTPTMSASDGTFNDRVRVQWSAITNATEYRVLRNTSTNKLTATLIASPAAPTLQHDDFTAVGGTTYQYWVDVLQDGILKPLAGPDAGFATLPPMPTGACCIGTICQVVTAPDCVSLVGTYLGDSVGCSAAACAPTGACCVGTSCQVETADDCSMLSGVYLGDATTCAGNPCTPTGACCVANVCQITTEASCGTANGEYLGDSSTCASDPCTPTGACCTGTVCQITTEVACSSMTGQYVGDDSTCDVLPCAPTGACCTGTMCQIVNEVDCAVASGIYLGDGETCANDPCAPPPPCPGDYNDDNGIDLLDLLAFNSDWSANLGAAVTPGTNGDYDVSGIVDLLDLLSFNGDWSANLGQPCP